MKMMIPKNRLVSGMISFSNDDNAVARISLLTVATILAAIRDIRRFADPTQAACGLFAFAQRVHARNLPESQRALDFVRVQLDRLGIGQELQTLPWGSKSLKLPPKSRRTSPKGRHALGKAEG